MALARWLPLAAAALGVVAFTSMGVWQLGRAGQKAALVQAYDERTADVPIYLNNRAKDIVVDRFDPHWWRYRRVDVAGEPLEDRQYLLDNRTRKGVAGYQVITPVRLERSRTVVLVNRGWVPLGASREALPDLAPRAPLPVVHGTVDFPRRTLLLGPDGYGEAGWPKVVQRVDLEKAADDLKSPVLPIVVLMDPEQPGGFVREWTPFLGISPDRHRAYAFQWFSLAVAVLVVTVVVRRRSRRDEC